MFSQKENIKNRISIFNQIDIDFILQNQEKILFEGFLFQKSKSSDKQPKLLFFRIYDKFMQISKVKNNPHNSTLFICF